MMLHCRTLIKTEYANTAVQGSAIVLLYADMMQLPTNTVLHRLIMINAWAAEIV